MADHDQAATNADADVAWFFSPQARFPQTSQFGFVALPAIIGLFSEQTVLKLTQVAESVFSKLERGANSTPPQKGSNKTNRLRFTGGPKTYECLLGLEQI